MSFYTQLNVDDNEKMLRNLGFIDSQNYRDEFGTTFVNGKFICVKDFSTLTINVISSVDGTIFIDGQIAGLAGNNNNGEIIRSFAVTGGVPFQKTINVFANFLKLRYQSGVSGNTRFSATYHYMKSPDPCCEDVLAKLDIANGLLADILVALTP